MILVDTTIVSVANPSIMAALDTTMVATLWATSAYLLAYAVPLLITGRLGDRFGPRRIYVIGLALFTLASFACGLAQSIEVLIIARVLQGLGAALMTPQTMAVITRIFEPRVRGSAMVTWSLAAGLAILVGPILGGALLDLAGWEWIFFVNVPVGIVGIVLAMRFVPKLPTSAHRFDWLGVVLSAVGMFLLVFGIQEGSNFGWGTIWGPITVWSLIVAGAVILVLFVLWQWRQKGEPLIPLRIFEDRNFSLGTLVILLIGIAVTGLSLPLMFYLQLVRGLTPLGSALILVPMAVFTFALAMPMGKFIDRRDPRHVPVYGMVLVAVSTAGYVVLALNNAPIWAFLLASAVQGVGNVCMWGPLATIATFSLPRGLDGAGSGVYNMCRQVGAVFGAAAMAVLMDSLLREQFGDASTVGVETTQLPEAMREGYTVAMAQSMLLPIAALLVGVVVALFFGRRPTAKTEAAQHP